MAGAVLVDLTGEEVALVTWQEAPVPPNGKGAVVVGAVPSLKGWSARRSPGSARRPV